MPWGSWWVLMILIHIWQLCFRLLCLCSVNSSLRAERRIDSVDGCCIFCRKVYWGVITVILKGLLKCLDLYKQHKGRDSSPLSRQTNSPHNAAFLQDVTRTKPPISHLLCAEVWQHNLALPPILCALSLSLSHTHTLWQELQCRHKWKMSFILLLLR